MKNCKYYRFPPPGYFDLSTSVIDSIRKLRNNKESANKTISKQQQQSNGLSNSPTKQPITLKNKDKNIDTTTSTTTTPNNNEFKTETKHIKSRIKRGLVASSNSSSSSPSSAAAAVTNTKNKSQNLSRISPLHETTPASCKPFVSTPIRSQHNHLSITLKLLFLHF